MTASMDKLASLALSGLTFEVRILDTRKVYGRTDLLVEPVAGSGKIWVAKKNVKVKK